MSTSATVGLGMAERWEALSGQQKLTLALFPVMLVAGYLYQPYCHGGPVLCLFRMTTGLPCPGCGMTRAWCELCHGHVGASLALHPVGFLLGAYLVWYAVSCTGFVVAGRRLALGGKRVQQAALLVLLVHFVVRVGTYVAAPGTFVTRLETGYAVMLIRFVTGT